MTAVTELDVPTLDYRDEELTGERFRETLRELRERSWIARADPFGWFVLDQEATAHFLRTKAATFPGRMVLEVQGVDSGPLYERLKGNLLDLDGEDHRRLRKLVQPAFTPKAADRLRPAMREQLEELLGAVAADGRCDFVSAIAKPYPARMIATVMGAPLEDAPTARPPRAGMRAGVGGARGGAARKRGGGPNVTRGQSPPVKAAKGRPAGGGAAPEFQAPARARLEQRRREPADDLLSGLIAA